MKDLPSKKVIKDIHDYFMERFNTEQERKWALLNDLKRATRGKKIIITQLPLEGRMK